MTYSYQTADPMLYDVLKEFARENRKNQTDAERSLWTELRSNQLGFKFKRQHIIGAYIADFVCLEHKVIVEVDGGYHSQPEQMFIDEQRTEWLEKIGYTVIRFKNEEITGDIERVLNIIFFSIKKLNGQKHIKRLLPSGRPGGG